MLVNIHLNSLHSKEIKLLYLYYRLRYYSLSTAGYFKNFKFTKNEKYNLLPKLIEKGWCTEEKVCSYRTICKNLKCVGLWAELKPEHLESINSLKGFIISSTETSVLKKNYKLQNKKSKKYSIRDHSIVNDDWVRKDNSWLYSQKINRGQYRGRCYNSILQKILNLSSTTISNWRKYSKSKYVYKNIISSYPSYDGRETDMFYKTKNNNYISKDLIITTDRNIDIFSFNNYNMFNLRRA